MEQERKIRVAITQGDTNGVGYELIFKTFSSPEMLELCTPIVYGSPKIATYHRKALELEDGNFSIVGSAADVKDGRLNLLTCFDDEVKVELGMAAKESAEAGVKALERAMADAAAGAYDVLVMCPLQKNEELKFPGQQTFVEQRLGKKAQLIVMNSRQRMAFMTADVALKDVAASITKEGIVQQTTELFNTIRRDLRVLNPRVAVLALNPSANGKEETDIITPALATLEESQVKAFGPYAAEPFFAQRQYDAFDGVLAMYHDQGMAPLHTLAADDCIRLLGGLDLVITMPDESPLFELAGKGTADEGAFRQAVYAAIDIWRNRQTYDEPLANPLPKLYHEKRDESEKVRFSIPKKHENSIKEKL